MARFGPILAIPPMEDTSDGVARAQPEIRDTPLAARELLAETPIDQTIEQANDVVVADMEPDLAITGENLSKMESLAAHQSPFEAMMTRHNCLARARNRG